jgi:hypothetical protein
MLVVCRNLRLLFPPARALSVCLLMASSLS